MRDFQCNFIVLGINLDNCGTCVHRLVVIDVDLLDVSRDSSTDRVEMHVHLRIIGRFEVGELVPQKDAIYSEHNDRAEYEPTLARALIWIT